MIDGRLLSFGVVLSAAVVIVGAGPAGITLAETLAETVESVILLDAGGREHRRRDDRALRGESSGRPMPLVSSRRRGFGGTSGHWSDMGLRIRPLDHMDFEPSPARPDASWPISRAALEPFYDRAHDVVERTNGYDPARWGLDETSTALTWKDGPELAMFQFAAGDSFLRRYDALVGRRNVDVVLNAQVSRLDLDATGTRVASATVAGTDGAEFRVVGTTFVVATGALEASRLLLASPGRDGRGLGNEHDNVGRYFMDRLSCDTGLLVTAPGVRPNVELFARRGTGDGERQPMLWLGPERIRREALLNGAFWLNPLDVHYLAPGVTAARALRQALHSTPRRDVFRHVRDVAAGFSDVLRYAASQKLGRHRGDGPGLALRFLGEQAPHRSSRITLSDRPDALGMPRVHLHWHVDDDDVASVRRHQDLLASLLEARGVGTIDDRFDPHTNKRPVMSNFHHLGGTRMHVDARRGVVDADCRVHGVPNLFVVGGSVFPAGGYVNPTLTIIALALRCADCVASELTPARLSTR